jgi:hypothetical protein
MQRKILTFLGSRPFLYLIVGIFAFEALWIAFTGRYPGAFDENFHLGLIQLYAKHWLPFLDAQPPNAEVYGAVARDPSYLYHYLMSFPYRVIAVFTHSQPAQIIILRIINVGLATVSLLLYAKILRRCRLSSGAQNAIMLLFTTVPVLPLLAGQINYDNLLFVLVALVVLMTIRFTEYVQKGILSGQLLGKILIISIFASLTKYAYLALFAGLVLYLCLLIFSHRKSLFSTGLRPLLRRYWQAFHRWHIVWLGVLFIIASGLFLQRYGINLVRYHTPVPDCAQVITVDKCLAYAPWQRDYLYVQDHTDWKREHIGTYANMWIHQMLRETYFTVYGAFFPHTTVVSYKTGEPLPFMIILGWTLFISGVVAILWYLPRLWRDPTLRLFILMTVLYASVLFVQNYKMYVETAVPVAIHGRYLLPLLPLLGVLYFRAYTHVFRYAQTRFRFFALHRASWLIGAWVVLLLICSQGGGLLTHTIRSDSNWFWQESNAAQKLNESTRKILRPLIIEQTL